MLSALFELGRTRRPFHRSKRDGRESVERVVCVEKCDMRDLVQVDKSARSQIWQGLVFSDEIFRCVSISRKATKTESLCVSVTIIITVAYTRVACWPDS